MTLHATCPTNGTEIDFGFPVYAAEDTAPPTGRGAARGTRMPSGDIRVEVTECPSCGQVHRFVTGPKAKEG
jgi:hypothetical protein